MQPEAPFAGSVPPDEWLEATCRRIAAAGREMAQAVGQVNHRLTQARNGSIGRRRLVTDQQFRNVQNACDTLRRTRGAVQNVLFDCEHELRELRERDVSPAELLIDGERLLRQYRFLRRRARVIDGLLAYLPAVIHHAGACLDSLRRLDPDRVPPNELTVPDCGFALVALEEAQDGSPRP
jgi:hypothetical protein